jgi:predicted nucleic acid-binding protein
LRKTERARLIPELRKHLSEPRSKAYRTASNDFAELTTLLIKIVENERLRLQTAADSILSVAEIIPLTADVFHRAKGIQSACDLSYQDSIVLASVLQHLTDVLPAESAFLNRKTKDFADPNILDMLDKFGCRFFGRFDHALAFIESGLKGR